MNTTITSPKLSKIIDNSVVSLTTKRVNGQIPPVKGMNVIVEQYMINKDICDRYADYYIKTLTPDGMYMYATPETIDIDTGIFDDDRGDYYMYARYLNKETHQCSTPVVIPYDNTMDDTSQLFAVMTVLYSIGKKIHYKALTEKIESYNGVDILIMALMVNF